MTIVKWGVLLPVLLLAGTCAHGQDALPVQQMSSLLIDGRQDQAKVIQVQNRNYVEIDDLARITGGSLRFVGNHIILTLPRSSDTPSPAIQPGPTPAVGYSRQFLVAGIEAMRVILEWHSALKTFIERGYPLSDEWFRSLEGHAQSSLKLAEAAASTDMDKKAFPLLANEFNTMTAVADRYLTISARRDYVAPDSLSKDPLAQKLLTCWRSLESMASSNQFVDDGSCR